MKSLEVDIRPLKRVILMSMNLSFQWKFDEYGFSLEKYFQSLIFIFYILEKIEVALGLKTGLQGIIWFIFKSFHVKTNLKNKI